MTPSPSFPCSTFPTDPTVGKLLGLYPQKQDGLWMQRVVVGGGRLTAGQWSALGRLAREITPGTPLHLTTRQDVEFHNLTAHQIPGLHRGLADAGLTTLGGGGDTLRNITVCPCSGSRADVPDLSPLAGKIGQLLSGYANLFRLPRKFKISLSACGNACGQPWINDLGLIARRRDGVWGFEVIAAGSLGAKPGTGIPCFDWLPAADVLPLALAAVRLFDAQGDREHRNKARLRHVRERLGDEAFVRLLNEELAKVKAEIGDATLFPLPGWASSPDWCGGNRVASPISLTFANGDVTPEAAEALADLAATADTVVRVLTTHQIAVFGPSIDAVRSAIGVHAALRAAALPQPCVIACTGGRWCKRGQTRTDKTADQLRAVLPSSFEGIVAVSGCPNGCAHSAIAMIGLIGQVSTVDGQKAEAYRMMVGGGCGQSPQMAQPAGTFPADEVPSAVIASLKKMP